MRRPHPTKKIGGKNFTIASFSGDKRGLQKTAKSYRKSGKLARIIKAGPWHGKPLPEGRIKKGKHYYVLYIREGEK